MTKKELLEHLEGMEIWSIDHACCIIVEDGQFISGGEVLIGNPTKAQLRSLFAEHIDRELGPNWMDLAALEFA